MANNQAAKFFIFGLGNPGDEYQGTRHNAGFLFLDYLQQRLNQPKLSFQKKFVAEVSVSSNLILAKPLTFMNKSGEAVQKIVSYYAKDLTPAQLGDRLFVAHDDLDLAVGDFKLQQGVGPKQHNGLNSIYQCVKTENFYHLRLGIDDRNGDRLFPPDRYVLQRLPPDQLAQLQQTVFPQVYQQLATYLPT